MSLLLVLHIAAMLAAFAFLPAAGLVVHIVASRAEMPVAQAVCRLVAPVFTIGKISVAIGVITGLILAKPFGYGSAWLVATYILAVMNTAIGAGIEEPWAKRLSLTNAGDYQAVLHEPLPRIGTWINLSVWLVFIWLMVEKPNFG
jgi:hypothetical protein